MKRVLVAILAAAFLLGACGDDGDSGGALGGGSLSAEEQAKADEIAASMMEDDNDSMAIEQEDADCVGRGFVRELGLEQLEEIDFRADDPDFALSEADADKAASVMVQCIDFRSGFADSFSEDGSISRESAECLAGKFDEKTVKELFAAELRGEEVDETSFIRLVTQGMADCLTDEELARMGD